jgi:hypothetical protein
LWLAIALPAVAAVARPRTAILATPFYLILIAGLFVYHVGLSFGGAPPARADAEEGPSTLCEQALEQAERGGLIVDRSNPQRVGVRRSLWSQLPQQAKDGLIMCMQGTQPPGAAGRQVAIVEVGGE